MKKSLLLLILGCVLISCHITSQRTIAYHPIVQHARQTSLYTDRVDWPAVNRTFTMMTQDSTRLPEALEYLINSMGDQHATFRKSSDYSIVASYTGAVQNTDTRDASFTSDVINDREAQFSYRMLEDDIGYLRVVGIAPGSIASNAQLIRSGLRDLKAQGVDQWILDLRYNGGGDMNPMLSGLAPLIGKGFIGGSVDRDAKLHHGYDIKNGQLYDNHALVTPMENDVEIDSSEKLVVLLSRYTISSGELLAIACKGRDHTRFIGEETAGYTTGNGWIEVENNMIMSISESIFVDRDMRIYNKVDVDEKIIFDHTINDMSDAQITRAIAWLRQ